MTTNTPKPFIGFILTPSFQVKPVEVRPHPLMDAYGILPTGRRVHLSTVYGSVPEAIQKGRDTIHKMHRSVAKTLETIKQREINLAKAHKAISTAGVKP